MKYITKEVRIGIAAVSYTHLDVYKRQPQLPAINNILPHINTSPYKSDYQQINPPITNSR